MKSRPFFFAFVLFGSGFSSPPRSAAEENRDLSAEDRAALEIGRAILKLDELGQAGAPLLSPEAEGELEKNVAFLAETPANRMTWAWLEFRLRNDRDLTLENNPGAGAIRQRLALFTRLLRKYFVFE